MDSFLVLFFSSIRFRLTPPALGLCPNIMMELIAGTLSNLLIQTKSTKVSGVARCAKILQLGPLASLKMYDDE
jgi:hypothetical protein